MPEFSSISVTSSVLVPAAAKQYVPKVLGLIIVFIMITLVVMLAGLARSCGNDICHAMLINTLTDGSQRR